MRKLIYVVNGQDVTSYEKVRELQPTGKLTMRLDEINKETKVNPITLKKRQEYFLNRKLEKAAVAN